MAKANNQSWGFRASVYEFLAFSFAYPDKELTEALHSGEWAAAAKEIAKTVKAPLTQEHMISLEEYTEQDTKELLHAIRVEHTRLLQDPQRHASRRTRVYGGLLPMG